MFVNFRRPHRSVLRSRLLLSTALIGVGALILAQGAHAQDSHLYFDNTDTLGTGNAVELRPESGEWGTKGYNSSFWRGLNNDGWWRRAGKISSGQIGVLTEGADGDGDGLPDPVTITIGNRLNLFDRDATVDVGGLRLDSGQYTFSEGLIRGGLNGDTLLLENNSGDVDSDLTVESGLLGKVEIAGTGDGAVVYAGNMLENDSEVSQLSVREGALFEITGTTSGTLQNQGNTVLVDGGEHSGRFVNGSTGQLSVDGTGTIDGQLVNESNGDLRGMIDIGADEHLIVSDGLHNSGIVALGGVLETPRLLNAGQGIISLTDADDRGNPTVRGGVNNYGKITVTDGASVELTIEDPDSAVQGDGDGVFLNGGTNGGFVLGQNSNLTINAEKFQFEPASNITVGHNLILNGEIRNVGTLTYEDAAGTGTINDTLINASRQVDGGSPLLGVLQFRTEVDAGGNIIVNDGKMTVGSDDAQQSSDAHLFNVGRISNKSDRELNIQGGLVETEGFGNQGIVNVGLAGGDIGTARVEEAFDNHRGATVNVNGGLIDVGDADHQGTFTNSGDVFINAVNDTVGTVAGDTIANNGLIDVAGELKARDLLVNTTSGEINVNGGLVDAARLVNRGSLNINFVNDTAGRVIGGTINNENLINVAGELNATALLYNKVGGTIDVGSGGSVDAARLDNAGELVIRSANGVAGAVTGGTITNSNRITVAGELAATTLLHNQRDSALIVAGGTVDATNVTNSGTLAVNINNGSIGTVTAGTSFTNNIHGTVNLNGTSLEVVDSDGTRGALNNSGRFRVNLNGANVGTVAADTVANGGTFDIAGDLIADSEFRNNGNGTVNVNGGVLQTVALDNSGEIFVNETGGVAGSVTVDTVANRNRIDVAGELAAATRITNERGGRINVNDGGLNTDEFVNIGALDINGGDGTVTAATAFDNNGGVVTVDGGNLSVEDSAGALGTLTNSGQIHVGMAGDTAGKVTADTIENSNIVTVAGNLIAESAFANDSAGQVVVDGGKIDTATFDNSGKLTIARDDSGAAIGTVTAGTVFVNDTGGEVNVDGGRLRVKDADGALGDLNNWGVVSVNVANGHTGTVEADQVMNRDTLHIAGAVTAATRVNNGFGSTINVNGGSLEVNSAGSDADVAGFENSGTLNVDAADGNVGTVTVGTRFLNNGAGSVVVSGGDLAVSDSAGVLGTLSNSGKLTVRNKDGQTGKVRAESVANDGGAVDVAGELSAVSEFINNKGKVTLSGLLDAGTSFGNIGELAGGEYIGTVQLDNGTLTADNLSNSGAITGSGRIRGDLENLGLIDIADGVLIGTEFANLAGGNMTFSGLARGAAGGDVNITNAGRMTLDADITGNLANTNNLSASGSISGHLTNAGNMTVRRDQTLELTSASEEGENTGNMTVRGTVRTESQLWNRADGKLDVLGGTIDGDVRNRGTMQLAGGGTVDGNVDNGGTLDANGTITGAVVQGQNGTLNVSDSLAVGSLSNSGTVNLNGTLTSDDVIANRASGVINLDGATVELASESTRAEGDILLNHGTINVLSDSSLLGGLTNHNLINMTEGDRDATLTVSGQFTNTSDVRVDGANSSLTITADRIALREGSSVELSQVTLIGDVLNSIDLLYDRATTLAGALLNDEIGSVAVSAAVDGNGNSIDNSGLLDVRSSGSLTNVADLTNRASGIVNIAEGGEVAAEDVINRAGGTMTVAGTLTANSEAGVINQGNLDLSGTLNGRLANAAGTVTLDGAVINGDVRNSSTDTRIGSLEGTVTIAGNLDNAGTADLAGSVRDVTNTGTLRTAGDLAVSSLSNAGTVNVRADHRLDSESDIANAGRFVIAGTLGSGLENRQDGTVVLSEGTVEGDVTNSGVLRGAGNIAGHLTQSEGATLRVNGALATGGLTNLGVVAVTNGNTLSSRTVAENQGRMNIGGTFDGNIRNSGTYVQNGRLEGSLTTTGVALVNGEITGDLRYRGLGDGSDLDITDAAAIRGTLDLGANFGIRDGRQITAGNTLVRRDVALGLNGTLNGDLTNTGIVQAGANALLNGDVTNRQDGIIRAVRSIEIDGSLANDGLINLAQNKSVGDKLTVNGGVSGSGVYALDINFSNMTSDAIVVAGGPATGNFNIQLNYMGDVKVSDVGQSTTLIDVSEEYQSANDFTYKVLNPQAIANEKVIYSLHRDIASGDIEMVSSIHPGIGALFGNISLTRSLIGVVVNRPTSPFVTGLAFDASDKPCGVGSWGRATGGVAEVTGGTDNGAVKVDSTINATYYGMQVGTDFACFDDRFAGWSMSFGGFLGVNQGDTTQPVYVPDPITGDRIGNQPSSINDTEFDQIYGGVYVTATKGRFQADLQYRHEKTDFLASNTALTDGGGLGLDDEEFSSKGNTLSGSLSYTLPIGEEGWTFVPSVGFAFTRSETDTITFSDGYQLEFEDSDAQIGFLAGTVAKTFVQAESNSALYAFATGTIYKDFADPSVSTFFDPNNASFEPQRLTSDNLGTYGELSVGANYIKVLQPGPGLRPRQLSASARIDARSGDGLESVGVTGQIRLQF
ncbi:hypothetical protein [Paracoccus onubensis]|uniref:Autotransporter domain-containing protein n=1 Tax=Paracoccus onubensis TaxID=1675788 RepID=A0A418T3W5_9RHOB|nr:hypothetical protein [Paracoccus onubensis]RJE87908.1 hypothetical protein D3P04_03005 [Paracoccus onubensis]